VAGPAGSSVGGLHDDPPDGLPDPHGRLPWLEPRHLSQPQQDTYERIIASRSGMASRASPVVDGRGRLQGPFNAMLFSPAVGGALQELGSALRSRGVLPARLREAAILEVARIRKCPFEWYSHSAAARDAGLSGEELAAIRAGADAPTLPPADRLARDLVQTLLGRRNLTEEQLAQALTALGADGVTELVTLVGYYDLLALSLQVWRTPMPGGIAGSWDGPAPQATGEVGRLEEY
jgi:4-carboxymuconolactone decarboxylase